MYLDYQVFEYDLLFTWDTPYLYTNDEIEYKSFTKIPNLIKMGELMNDVMPLLKSYSLFIEIEKLEETDTMTNTQINYFGIEYAGFPRKFEARFENNKLNMVWILTGKGEENRLRRKLTAVYGKVLFVNGSWEVFNNWTVLLRKIKPGILFLPKDSDYDIRNNIQNRISNNN